MIPSPTPAAEPAKYVEKGTHFESVIFPEVFIWRLIQERWVIRLKQPFTKCFTPLYLLHRLGSFTLRITEPFVDTDFVQGTAFVIGRV